MSPSIDRQARWDCYYLKLAYVTAGMSKDPRTQVGACLVGEDRQVLSLGYNGLPRGILDSRARLDHKDMKLRQVVHAEINAVMNAARSGISTRGSTLYLIAKDDGPGPAHVWGGPPCERCAVELIQAGIKEVVAFPFKEDRDSSWATSVRDAYDLLKEAGVGYREVDVRWKERMWT